MTYNRTTEATHSIATISRTKERIARVIITVDTHTTNTAHTQATALMYPESVLSGAGTLTREQFLDKVNRLGASIDIKTTSGQTTYVLSATDETMSKLLRLFKTMMDAPTFQTKELSRVQSIVKNNLHQSREDSKAIALDELRNHLYHQTDRRYAFSIDTLLKEVATVSKKDLQAAHDTIKQSHWYVSIAGNETVIEQATKSIKQIRGAKIAKPSAGTHRITQSKDRLHLHNVPGRQNIDFSIGLPIPITTHHPDYAPLSFGIAVLAKWGGFAGRLMSTIREKEGLTYGIYGKLEGFTMNEQGYFRIMTFFAPQRSVEALTSTFREIAKLYENGITKKEFEAFKTILDTQQQLLNDSITRQIADLHSYHCQGFSLEEMKQQKDRLHQITKAEVNTAIKTYLNPTDMHVSGAGPISGVEKELQQWMKTMS